MIDRRYTITTDATREVEDLLAQFERDRIDGPVDLLDYLLPGDDPAYAAVVTELARIDLEHAFENAQTPQASKYIDSFPDVFCDDTHRAQLVFEEYRLRRRAGEDVDAATLASHYNIEGGRWPKLKLGTGESEKSRLTSRRFGKEELAIVVVKYPRVGETFAGYPLAERLGEGAFSRVFLARQPDLASRPVVLKVTPLSTDESDRLARLQHTNIIPIYSVHREGDLSCICMPFLGATTLADLSPLGERWASLDGPAEELVSTILDRRRSTIGIVRAVSESAALVKKDAEEANGVTGSDQPVGLAQYSQLGYVDALLTLVIGAVEGLAHAHQRGIIHRDLKPANILVSDDGNPLLLDFNLAVASHEPKTRIVGGTLPYMSPQQLAALETGDPADARDDVFSMGVILYELLTGHLPFDCPKAGEEFELAHVIAERRRTPPGVHFRNARVSVGLSDIISTCVAPDRNDRYQHAGELLDDLNRHRQHLPLSHAPNRSIRERLSKWSTRHPSISSASFVATLAAIILVALGSMIYQRGQRIARLDAQAKLQAFQSKLPSAITALSTPGRELEILEDGLSQSQQLMTSWVDPPVKYWKAESGVNYLDRKTRDELGRQLSRLAYLMADAESDVGVQSGSNSEAKKVRKEHARQWNKLARAFDGRMTAMAEQQDRRINLQFEGRKPAEFDDDNLDSNHLDLRTLVASQAQDASLLLKLTSKQLNDQPSNVSLWFYSAIANARLGEWNNAIASLSVCDSLQPQSLATLFNRGLLHLQAGNPDAAREDFTACITIKPGMLTARFNRAVAAQRIGELELALRDLNAVVDSGRATTRMVLMRRQIHQQLGNEDAAKADFVNAMAIPPRDANDWVSRGVSRLTESPQHALEDFLAALRVDPQHFDALQNSAHVYAERLNEPARALEMLDRLALAWPGKASPISSRGIIHARLSNLDSAFADARAAELLNPTPREQLQIAGIYAIGFGEVGNEHDEPTQNEARSLAISWLARALRNDPALAKTAGTDSDLASLRNDASFRRLVGSAMTLESSASLLNDSR